MKNNNTNILTSPKLISAAASEIKRQPNPEIAARAVINVIGYAVIENDLKLLRIFPTSAKAHKIKRIISGKTPKRIKRKYTKRNSEYWQKLLKPEKKSTTAISG